MAKIVRKTQKIFGVNAGIQQIAQYGSLANSTPNFTTDPAVIQALGQYLSGWFDAVIGGNSPAIEDMNALCYLYAYQLAYVMQAGIAEWDAGTTYYIGSLASDSSGFVYKSVIDDNLNNAFTVAGAWVPFGGLTKNSPPTPEVDVASGTSLTIPNLSIPSTGAYSVASGASLISFNSLIVQSGGSLVVAPGGQARVI